MWLQGPIIWSNGEKYVKPFQKSTISHPHIFRTSTCLVSTVSFYCLAYRLCGIQFCTKLTITFTFGCTVYTYTGARSRTHGAINSLLCWSDWYYLLLPAHNLLGQTHTILQKIFTFGQILLKPFTFNKILRTKNHIWWDWYFILLPRNSFRTCALRTAQDTWWPCFSWSSVFHQKNSAKK